MTPQQYEAIIARRKRGQACYRAGADQKPVKQSPIEWHRPYRIPSEPELNRWDYINENYEVHPRTDEVVG